MREIVYDLKPHTVGEREVADWDRLVDGRIVTFRDVPLVYLRPATRDEYLAQHPCAGSRFPPGDLFFWEVSID
jgi:hypothetical protein